MRYVVILIFSLSYIGLHCQMVSDRAVLFRAGEVTSLASLTHEIQKKTSVPIWIYTVNNLNRKTSIEYAQKLIASHPVGIRGINNGVIILIAKNDHTIHILNGFGMEWLLPDKECQAIIDKMIPDFQNKQFYKGIIPALDSIASRADSADWSIHNLATDEMKNGAIYKTEYSDRMRNAFYRHVKESEPQFSNQYRITLAMDGTDFYLYYSKYMTDLIKQITASNKVTLYFRVENLKEKKLQLLGVE